MREGGHRSVRKHCRKRGTLAVLRRLGVPWGHAGGGVRAVGEECRVSGLRWLVEQGVLVGSRESMGKALKQAAGQEHDGHGQCIVA